MNGNHPLSDFEEQPRLSIIDGKISFISNSFLKLTGYSISQLLDKGFSEAVRALLKSNYETIETLNTNEVKNTFLFTKSLHVKKVGISLRAGSGSDERIYSFEEEADRKLENQFQGFDKLLEDNRFCIGIFSCPDFTLLKVNQAYLDLLEDPYRGKETSLGLKISDLPLWKDDMLRKRWQEVLESGKTFYGKELERIAENHKKSFYDHTIIPIHENDSVRYIISMIEDVTATVLSRNKLEEQARTIHEQKEQLEKIIENMSDGIFIIDDKGNFLRMNAEMRRQHYKPETIKVLGDGFKLTRYLDMSDNEIPQADMPAPRALRGEKVENFRLKLQRPDKDIIMDVNACPVYDVNNKIIMSVVCSRDITDKVNQTKIIQEQKELFEAVIENISDPLLVFDAEGNYINLNRAARNFYRIIGTEITQVGDILKSHECFDVGGNPVRYEDFPAVRVMEGETVSGFRISVRNGDSFVYADVFGVPIYDDNGSFTAGILYIRDVTHKVIYENMAQAHQEELLNVEKEKNEALENSLKMKDEFLSMISHEFKTPLTVIDSAIQAMELICRNELSNKAKSFISKIRQNSLRQLRLVNNLLDISRANAESIKLNKKNIDIVFLVQAITESVSLYAHQKGIKLTFVSTLEKKIIGIDDEKFERILLNLLSNAIKFTPAGKSVTVKVGSYKGSVLIEVKDDGLGIPKDKQDLIFERFGQVDSSLSRQAEGTGIGLTLVKLLTEALGGTISVKSKPGVGSTFKIKLSSDKINETVKKVLPELSDDRLVKATAIEFSDIYLK